MGLIGCKSFRCLLQAQIEKLVQSGEAHVNDGRHGRSAGFNPRMSATMVVPGNGFQSTEHTSNPMDSAITPRLRDPLKSSKIRKGLRLLIEQAGVGLLGLLIHGLRSELHSDQDTDRRCRQMDQCTLPLLILDH